MDGIWEPLADLDLNLHGANYPVHCLCSRAFIRSKMDIDYWNEVRDLEKCEEVGVDIMKPLSDSDAQILEHASTRKLEAEISSCYCSASHYSTDDYESVMQSTSDHYQMLTNREQPVLYPLHNSDSGADLSENFVERPCLHNDNSEYNTDVIDSIKSKLDIAWEKYWAVNGENIIWRSWIEKYGAYINPSYLEQNNLNEMFDMEIDDLHRFENQEENIELTDKKPENEPNCEKSCSSLKDEKSHIFSEVKEYSTSKNPDDLPNLKISCYSSTCNLTEEGTRQNINVDCLEIEPEENLLKSGSFESYETFEKYKNCSQDNGDDEHIKNYEHERVRSRCSNTNLSVKSIANTTVTTDSMTNVTKITLSSLDLSCECESNHGSSLSSTCTDDSSELTSNSSSSSKEEMCTEADAWWRKLWKEHYEEQYSFSYKKFGENFKDKNIDANNEENGLLQKDLNHTKRIECQNMSKRICKQNVKEDILNSPLYLNSVSHVLDRLENAHLLRENADYCGSVYNAGKIQSMESNPENTLVSKDVQVENGKRQLELSEDDFEESEDDNDEFGDRSSKRYIQKRSYQRDSNEKVIRPVKTLDNIKQALTLMGYSYRLHSDVLKSGYVTFRKKNIRGQNRKLKLSDTKHSTHVFFDDDGNYLCESKQSENLGNGDCAGEDSSKTENEEINMTEQCVIEKESLGYEAHSSSVDEEIKLIDENKKQKKRKKRQRKCNNIPSEVEENQNLLKYWIKRYKLFSKYDEGIKMDAESWYSVTPEKVAMHHAQRCRCDIIIDAFCGAGGNSIQFAFTCERVIAIDNDPKKIEIAKNNAKVYGVEDRIEFIIGDFTKLAVKLQADVVFLSPPWGGPEYSNVDVYSLENILPPLGGNVLFDLANNITTEVAYFLPKNVNSMELAILPGPGGEVEIEQNFLGRKLTSLTAYFGELIRDPDDPFMEKS